jgi:hypothetical protein
MRAAFIGCCCMNQKFREIGSRWSGEQGLVSQFQESRNGIITNQPKKNITNQPILHSTVTSHQSHKAIGNQV